MKLEEMKKIAEKRTSGTWEHGRYTSNDGIGEFYYITAVGRRVSSPGFGDPKVCVHGLPGDNEFISMASNNWDKLVAVVEAAAELSRRLEPAFPKPGVTYPNDKLNKALLELEKE